MPGQSSGGTYHLIITAANGVGSSANQSFTLTVNQAPSISTAIAPITFNAGLPNTFSFAASGFPTPTLTETGALPSGVIFVDNGNGTATLYGTPEAGSGGQYTLTVTASNGIGSSSSQNFGLSVVKPPPSQISPVVLSLQRLARKRATHIILSFDQPMNAQLAGLKSNYFLQPLSHGQVVKSPKAKIRVSSPIYDPGTQTVNLTPAKRLNVHQSYQITVNGLAPNGLTNLAGLLLDGAGNNIPGSNFVFVFAASPGLTNIPGAQ
jgi:hypothetical protein